MSVADIGEGGTDRDSHDGRAVMVATLEIRSRKVLSTPAITPCCIFRVDLHLHISTGNNQ